MMEDDTLALSSGINSSAGSSYSEDAKLNMSGMHHQLIHIPSENVGDSGGFEGPEKILEIDFVQGLGKGLRQLPREKWDKILDLARCKILCSISNDHLDAYVLSESSLFVFNHKCFLKTCGTTTLLRCLPLLLEEVRKTLGMELEWLGYSRKNFTFPSDQQFPHTSFTSEVSYTKKCNGPRGEQLVGGAYVLGDLTSDHWYVYVADYCQRDLVDSTDISLNIMMHDLDPEVSKLFFADDMTCGLELEPGEIPNKTAGRRATIASGIDKLVPGAHIDDWLFEPCGYSMNAILFDTWYTIHVTPENGFSYASFETNLHAHSYEAMLRNVLSVFRPRRFTVTMFADRGSFGHMSSVPNDISRITLPAFKKTNYKRVTRSSTCLAVDYICDMGNYILDENPAPIVIPTESPFSFLLDEKAHHHSPGSGSTQSATLEEGGISGTDSNNGDACGVVPPMQLPPPIMITKPAKLQPQYSETPAIRSV